MLFNSVSFFIFFPLVALAYFACGRFVRRNMASQVLLLAASLYFYACWNPWYLFLILFSVAATWLGAIALEGKPVRQKKLVVALVVIANLGILFFFKYYDFFCDSVDWFARLFGDTNAADERMLPRFSLLLPVGISFYTFQALGYMIDVYRGDIRAERNFITYALFVTFFPQLVAGPIERSRNLLPQFKTDHAFDYNRATAGMRLFAWGLFKKVVVADQLALYVDALYWAADVATGLALLLATFFFAFQIFCDFSGYSDMAIGVAKILGFTLMKNFDRPYTATSIGEFWRQWHISLSTWFKDYVYIPLGGNRCGPIRHSLNLMATFMVSGLWHGASWHFVAWGAAHGLLQIADTSTVRIRKSLRLRMGLETAGGIRPAWRLVQALGTFVLVVLAWMLFRANTMADAAVIWSKFLALPQELVMTFKLAQSEGLRAVGYDVFGLNILASRFGGLMAVVAMANILLLLVVEWLGWRYPSGLGRLPSPLRWTCYVVLACVTLCHLSSPSEFIYFQF